MELCHSRSLQMQIGIFPAGFLPFGQVVAVCMLLINVVIPFPRLFVAGKKDDRPSALPSSVPSISLRKMWLAHLSAINAIGIREKRRLECSPTMPNVLIISKCHTIMTRSQCQQVFSCNIKPLYV